MSLQHDFIEFALDTQVLRFGEFKTKAGRLSPYFFNLGLFNTGKTLARLADFYAETLLKAKKDRFLFLIRAVQMIVKDKEEFGLMNIG